MKKSWIELLLIFVLLLPLGCENEKATENDSSTYHSSHFDMQAALKGLKSKDEATIRKSIILISDNMDTEDMHEAEKPLIKLFSEEHDKITISYAATTLASMSKNYEWDKAEKLLDPIVKELFASKSEFARVSAAKALGKSGKAETIDKLEISLKMDRSIWVRTAAENSINEIKKINNISDKKRLYSTAANDEKPLTFNTLSANGGPKDCVTEEEYEWISKHFIFFIPETTEITICD